jgi:hypothetical protein
MRWQYWLSVATPVAATGTASSAATAGTASPATATRAASPAAATGAASPGATAAVGSRTSLIDVNGASLQILAVHFVEGVLGFIFGGHLDESKSSRLATVLVSYDIYGLDLTELLKSLAQIILGCLGRQVSHINIHFAFLIRTFQDYVRSQLLNETAGHSIYKSTNSNCWEQLI